jgi:hypothetical protein
MHGDSDLFLMNPKHFNTLVHAYLDGTLSPLQKLELEQALRDSVEHRAQFWKQTEFHGQLRGVAESEALWRGLEQASEIQMVSSRSRSWFRNPLAAAAAGFVLCLFCTSSVRAYMGQWVSKVRPLPVVNGGFEGSSEIGISVPKAVGVWSGDFSCVTGAENGVTPYQGGKMLRFVRADNEVSDPGATHHIGEVLQIIDLRPFQADLARGKAQIEISARFAAGTQDSGYYFSLRAISFRGPINWAAEAWRDRAEYGRTAAERRVETSKSASGPVWQKVQLHLPVLPDTDFLILQGAATRLPKPKGGVVEFPAHYMDDVTAQLRINRVEGDS